MQKFIDTQHNLEFPHILHISDWSSQLHHHWAPALCLCYKYCSKCQI